MRGREASAFKWKSLFPCSAYSGAVILAPLVAPKLASSIPIPSYKPVKIDELPRLLKSSIFPVLVFFCFSLLAIHPSARAALAGGELQLSNTSGNALVFKPKVSVTGNAKITSDTLVASTAGNTYTRFCLPGFGEPGRPFLIFAFSSRLCLS